MYFCHATHPLFISYVKCWQPSSCHSNFLIMLKNCTVSASSSTVTSMHVAMVQCIHQRLQAQKWSVSMNSTPASTAPPPWLVPIPQFLAWLLRSTVCFPSSSSSSEGHISLQHQPHLSRTVKFPGGTLAVGKTSPFTSPHKFPAAPVLLHFLWCTFYGPQVSFSPPVDIWM